MQFAPTPVDWRGLAGSKGVLAAQAQGWRTAEVFSRHVLPDPSDKPPTRYA
jgi:hypothetical protein